MSNKTYWIGGALLLLFGTYLFIIGWLLTPADTDEVDWKYLGVVTAVKDQSNNCQNASWVFATVASIEGLMGVKSIQNIALEQDEALSKTRNQMYSQLKQYSSHYNIENLSEQQLLDCTPADDNCEGGSLLDAYQFANLHGIVNYQIVPYIQRKEICPRDRISESVFNITGYQMTSGCDNLKRLIFEQPVAVKIDYSNLKNYQTYDLDINYITTQQCPQKIENTNDFNNSASDPTQIQYVLVTAYDGQTFTIKNSVGLEWGHQGYAKIDATIDNTCNICEEIYYPLKDD